MTIRAFNYHFVKLFVLISIFTLILSSCDIVDSIFGSGDEDVNGTVDPGYNLIGTQVIGSTGGEINLDSIIVNVPSGAFDENTEISIYVGENNDGFDEYGISSLYQISGLPGTINKPIRLSIKYHGTLEGDTLVAIGEMHHATSLDSTLYSYHTENASDSSGYLVYYLPVDKYYLPVDKSLAKLALPEDAESTYLKMVALGFYKKMLSSNGNFMLSYPLFLESGAISMGEHFEEAFKTCEDMGFDLSPRSWSTHPANVLAKPLSKADKNTGGWYSQFWFGDEFKDVVDVTKMVNDEILRFYMNAGNFTINLSYLSDDPKLRTVCGHEFLHLVQQLYEFYDTITPEQRWLEEATAVWIMEKFSDLPNYVYYNLDGRELYPFFGWQYLHKDNNEDDYAEQGYGLSSIIKEIADFQGERSIVDIFEKIKAGTLPTNPVDPIDAVISVLWEPVEEFWHGVLSSYVLGEYYNSQVNFRFLDDPVSYEKGGTIDPTNNKLSFKYNYHDLSGKLFLVGPGDLSTLATVPLSFKVDDPANCGILVCKFKQGSEITKIGEVFPGGSGVVILDDAKPIFDAGYYLVVMVSNSSHDKSQKYRGTNTVELTVELETPPEDPQENIVKGFSFGLDIDNYTGREKIGEEDWKTETGRRSFGLTPKGSSSFENNVYNIIMDYSANINARTTGNASITILDDRSKVNIHIDMVETWNDAWNGTDYTGVGTAHTIIDYDGIPFDESLVYSFDAPCPTYDIYKESGSSVSRVSISYSYVAPTHRSEYISHTCGADASIEVYVCYKSFHNN